ncbi:Protein CBG04661 [Caenorhabditis briggsae]|uniref:Protein CBG04661 n=1 Tax=Caenorhabditis briggsae TaxID=6238 RepID=A8WY65_CAEBR|nr:Protein CBG04661 [Caenorhabditis briggsae]CAP25323.2 Protein CBG04661 [Caenorhabditis briggsae]
MANKENSMDTGDDVDAQQKEIKAMKRKFDEMSEKLQSMEESISKISKIEAHVGSNQEEHEKSINPTAATNQEKMTAEFGKHFELKHVFANIAEWYNGDYKYSEDEEHFKNLASESSEYQKKFGKSFVLKHVFKNVGNLGGSSESEKEDHFGMFWSMCLEWKDGDLILFVDFSNPISLEKKWSIETKIEVKIIGKKRNVSVGPTSRCLKASGKVDFERYPYFPCLEELEEGLLGAAPPLFLI